MPDDLNIQINTKTLLKLLAYIVGTIFFALGSWSMLTTYNTSVTQAKILEKIEQMADTKAELEKLDAKITRQWTVWKESLKEHKKDGHKGHTH